MKLNLHPAHMDLSTHIPAQPGLCFDVNLNLQNLDELHLSASALWVEWFPCTNLEKVAEYCEAVSGLLSGRFRISEHWRGGRVVKAERQRPDEGGWNTIAGWSILLSIPWPQKSFKIVQNLPAVESV